jgi:NAD(P)-dependent dehydrogenase (short-subunit alcohol dehydrogenase family)
MWAVILGASTGTGAAVAREVSTRPGLDVFGVHRGKHPELAATVTSDIERSGRRARLVVDDAGTIDGAERGADSLLALAGKRSVKLFVHSLASAALGTFVDGTAHGERALHPRQLASTFEVMAHSFVYWTQALVMRDLLAEDARLLGLANTLTEGLVRNGGAISASKAALEMYIRQLAFELGPRGHRVNLLKFGGVRTCASEKTFPGAHGEDMWRSLARSTFAGRTCTLDEVAAFIAVLCDDAASWFNGATIDFTGGQTYGLFDAMVYPSR